MSSMSGRSRLAVALLLYREQQLGVGIAHALQQGQDDLSSLVRMGGCEAAFPNALMDDLGYQRRALFENRLVHFQPHDGVVVGVPDACQLDHIRLVGDSQPVQRIEKALEFFDRRAASRISLRFEATLSGLTVQAIVST